MFCPNICFSFNIIWWHYISIILGSGHLIRGALPSLKTRRSPRLISGPFVSNLSLFVRCGRYSESEGFQVLSYSLNWYQFVSQLHVFLSLIFTFRCLSMLYCLSRKRFRVRTSRLLTSPSLIEKESNWLACVTGTTNLCKQRGVEICLKLCLW